MALLPTNCLNAVVSVGIGDDPAQRIWVGTGFFYGTKVKDQDKYQVFLITNKHVLQGVDSVWLRFNKTSVQESEDYRLILKNADTGAQQWSSHPTVDVAACGFILINQIQEAGYDAGFLAADTLAETKQELKSRGATEGDGIFLLGFPMSLIGQERRYVICRSGYIARIQDMHEGLNNQYLVDAMVFPGNSGGPVISRPQLSSLQGTQAVHTAKLIGIVTSYVPYQDVAESRQTRRVRVVFEENSGLAVVLPIDYVNEVAKLERDRLIPPDP